MGHQVWVASLMLSLGSQLWVAVVTESDYGNNLTPEKILATGLLGCGSLGFIGLRTLVFERKVPPFWLITGF